MITVPPNAYELPDVSFYQRPIDWGVMKSKTKAIVLRYSQGNYRDSQIAIYHPSAAGMYRMGYHFFDGRYSPTQQANKIIELLETYPLEGKIFMDWERSYNGNYEGIGEVISTMQAVEKVMGDVWGFYTGYYYFIENTQTMTQAQRAYLSTKPLWLAWYADASIVKIPDTWSNWYLWQYGTPARGYQYGCPTIEIDMNFYNGTLEDLTGGTQPPPSGGQMLKGRVLRPVNMRTQPNTSAPVLGTLQAGQIVTAEIENAGWWKLATIDNIPPSDVRWSAQSYAGVTYIEPITDAPAAGDIVANITLKADGTITGTWTEQ